MKKRIFSVQEKNFLTKYNLSPNQITNDIPVEYVAHRAEFYGREFYVNQSVLIPRIETEEIIDIVVKKILQRHPGPDQIGTGKPAHPGSNRFWASQNDENITEYLQIADVGTGSGCIGLTLFLELKKKNTHATVYLSDISSDALTVAKQNIKKLITPSEQKNIFIMHADLFSPLPQTIGHQPLILNLFDIIVANLPYIPTERIQTLDSSVKDFEPHMALDGGENGTKIINTFLGQLPNFLKPDGFAILEIDDTHTLSSFAMPTNLKAEIIKDSFSSNRFLLINKQ